MKKVLVGLAVMAAAAVLAWLLVVPAGGKKSQDKIAATPTEQKAAAPRQGVRSEDGTGFHVGTTGPTEATAAPPPGTLRPLNPAEIAQQARFARPYNKHVDLVGAWWGRAGQLLKTSNPDLMQQTVAMTRYLQEMQGLNDDQFKVSEVLAKEAELVEKLDGSSPDPEMKRIVGYIRESIRVTDAGGDPTTVVKP